MPTIISEIPQYYLNLIFDFKGEKSSEHDKVECKS
jgi:hypothetical protein